MGLAAKSPLTPLCFLVHWLPYCCGTEPASGIARNRNGPSTHSCERQCTRCANAARSRATPASIPVRTSFGNPTQGFAKSHPECPVPFAPRVIPQATLAQSDPCLEATIGPHLLGLLFVAVDLNSDAILSGERLHRKRLMSFDLWCPDGMTQHDLSAMALFKAIAEQNERAGAYQWAVAARAKNPLVGRQTRPSPSALSTNFPLENPAAVHSELPSASGLARAGSVCK